MSLYKIAVEAPLDQPLTYSSETPLSPGQLVVVPLGRRQVQGVVLEQTSEPTEFQVKEIAEIKTDYPPLPSPFIHWLSWLSNYYFHPLGMTFSSAFPPLEKTTKVRKSSRPAVVGSYEPDTPPELTLEQQKIFNNISTVQKFSTHLIFGVTGSGKTEIYLRLLEETLKRGKTGIVLVPEISLTPQLVTRFAKRFGDQVAVIHSQLTDRERTNQWWAFSEGDKKILVGARSALFCPTKDLGIVIVDEEHEPSFKQEEMLKYNGRDSAVMLGKFFDCPVILGSATPSLETWKNAQDGKYVLHHMRERVGNRSLPDIQIVDLRKVKEDKQQKLKDELPFWLSQTLYHKLAETLTAGYQVALFLNRRGVAQMVICSSCGHTRECPNCDINLTLHGKSHLVCHYCDYHENLRSQCSECSTGEMKPFGLGTEKLESDLAELFPEKQIARADRDEIQSRVQMEELVERMELGEIDILVGTQMIAKGLDFPKLKTVGLVLADVGFNLPDFRATERSFQLITQMGGRAGRHIQKGETAGQVVVQTYNPSHESLEFAMAHDFEGFAANELQNRQALMYPPWGKLAAFRIQGSALPRVEEVCQQLSNRARALQRKFVQYKDLEILGPAEAPLSRLKGQFRFHLLLKGPGSKEINSFVRQVLGDQEWMSSGVRISVDIDPMNLL